MNPMYTNQDLEEIQHDLDKPRITVCKNLQFCQTRSHAIALFKTPPAICVEKVVFMKTGEELYCKVHQSPMLPRAALTPNLHHGRQDLSNLEGRTSADRQSERSAKFEETRRLRYEETRRGNVEGVPRTTVQKEDSNHKEIVRRLIQQFERTRTVTRQ